VKGIGGPRARKEDMSGDPRRIRKEHDIMLSSFLIWPFIVIFTYASPIEIDFLPRIIISFIIIYGVLFVNNKINKRIASNMSKV